MQQDPQPVPALLLLPLLCSQGVARRRSLSDGSDADSWAGSLSIERLYTQRQWAEQRSSGFPGAHAGAPRRTSDTQIHHLKWKYKVPGNLELAF